jgi:hypothetical protein
LSDVIRARTDELYEAVEGLQPLFKLVMAAVLLPFITKHLTRIAKTHQQ